MARLRIGKPLSKKIADKIESSVPDEYKQPGVVIKPEEKRKEFIPEWKPTGDEVTPASDVKTILPDAVPKVTSTDHTYIESLINVHTNELKSAQDKINAIKTTVIKAERVSRVLRHINKSKASIDVKWLINKIGAMKGNPTSLDDLEQDIYDFVEIQMDKKKIE